MSILASSSTISRLCLPTCSRRAGEVRAFGPSVVSRIVIAALVGLSLVGSAAFLSFEITSRAHPVLAWFTLFPLLALIRFCSARTAGLCGAIWGASLFCFLTLQAQALVPSSMTSAAFLIGLPALYASGMVWVTRRFGFNPLILAFGWCGVEFALLPLGLRGGLLGGIAGESGSFLNVLQGLLGYVCMAALIVAVNAIALSLLTRAYAKACASPRIIRGAAAGPRLRLIPRETTVGWHFYAHAAQPRAPPVALA